MRSGSHVQLAALRNSDLELQTTSPFSNHGSVERSTACFRHKNVLQFCVFQKFPFFCVTLYLMLFALNWHKRNTTFLTAEDMMLQHRHIRAVTSSAMYVFT